MQYILYDLGQQLKGGTVEVSLSLATNVRLLDKVNLDLLKNGQKYTYYGGYVTENPYRIPIPETRRWYVTIDPVETLKHGVRVSPAKLPAAVQEERALSGKEKYLS